MKQTFLERLEAFRERRQLFFVPDFGRYVFADNLRHCQKKFNKHTVHRASFWEELRYLIWGA